MGLQQLSSRAKSQRCAAANRIAIVIEMAMISSGAEEDHGGNSANCRPLHYGTCRRLLSALHRPRNRDITRFRCRLKHSTGLLIPTGLFVGTAAADVAYNAFSSCFYEVCRMVAIFEQEAQLSPSDRAMRLVSSNLANCHATVQKLLIRQVLTKLMV